MLKREGDVLVLEGPVTFDTVPSLVGAAEEHWSEGPLTVDFGRVTDTDSAAVALALEWLRQAAGRKVTLRLRNLPTSMNKLAELYGVSEFLNPASR